MIIHYIENAAAHGKEKVDINKKSNQPLKALIKKTEKQEKEENSKLDAQNHINNAIIPNQCNGNIEANIHKAIENEINQSENNNNAVKTEDLPKKIALNYNEITHEKKTWSVLTK